MTAPVATARQNPAGRQLGEGYQTLITFAADPNVEFAEMSVTPPGINGGPAHDTTTQHNTTYVTKSPGTLLELTDSQATVRWDPVCYTSCRLLVNKRTTVTHTFPDGSTLAAYGFLMSFQPGALVRGTPPEATITIVYTNQDPVTCEEEDPVYTAGSGTSPSC